jgi:hypothetical protein
LEDLYQEYNPEGFIPISVVIQDSSGYPATAEDAALWADELELTFPVLADSTGSFNETWNPDLVLPKVVHILLDGTPEGVEIPKVIQKMIEIEGVSDVHHIHIWQLDEQRNALEAHVVLQDWEQMEGIKFELKKLLKKQFSIEHSTLEFEQHECPDSENNACYET